MGEDKFQKKTKILSSLVEGFVQLRVKAIREVGEGKLSISKQEPPTSTKPHLVALTPYPIPVLQICSLNSNSYVPPRPLTNCLILKTNAAPESFMGVGPPQRPPPKPP